MRTPQKTPVVLENQLILCQFLFGQKIAAQSFCGIADFPICARSERTLLGHIMGVGASVDLAVPPGGSTLVLMNPTECFQTKPKIDSTQKPLCLSTLGDAEWNEWMGKLQHIVNRYWNEMLPFFLAPFAAIPIFGIWIAEAAGVPEMPIFVMLPLMLLVFVAMFGGRFFVVAKNQGREQETESRCPCPRDIIFHKCAPFSFKTRFLE